MARTTIDDGILTDVADAIRAKTETTDSISPVDFADMIESISGGGSDIEVCEISLMANSTSVIVPTDKTCADVNYICMVPIDCSPYSSSGTAFVGVCEFFPNGINLGGTNTYYALGVANNWGNPTKGFNIKDGSICEDSDDGITITLTMAKGDYVFIIV